MLTADEARAVSRENRETEDLVKSTLQRLNEHVTRAAREGKRMVTVTVNGLTNTAREKVDQELTARGYTGTCNVYVNRATKEVVQGSYVFEIIW